MTIEQRIQWVVLPAGVSADGKHARLSIFAAPRLHSDEGNSLSLFPDFLDWPTRLSTITFMLATTDVSGTPIGSPVGPLAVGDTPADSALWRRFFPPDTPVESFTFDDFRGRPVMTYPARTLGDSVRTTYAQTAAVAPADLPPPAEMSRLPGLAQDLDMAQAEEQITQRLATFMQAAADRPLEFVRPELSPQQQFLAFHRPVQVATLAAAAESEAAPPSQRIDFHQMLSAVGDHRLLQRRLGLVVDLLLPIEQLTGANGELGLMVLPTWEPLLTDASHDHTPATIYAFVTGEGFCPSSSAIDPLGPPAHGLVALPDAEFSIEQADIDGAALKIAAASAATSAPAQGQSAPAGLPSVRTKGLALVRDGRAGFLHADFKRAAEREDALTREGAVTLLADDLIRGHRMDIFDNSRQRWFSLHQRVVTYNHPGGAGEPIATATDEGFFQVSLATPPGATTQLHVHEHVITWDGWALSAPRPGKALSEDLQTAEDGQAGVDAPQRITNTAATTLPLEIEVDPLPGSLPRLRFGHEYRMRVRTVDLAGNGPTVEEADQLLDRDILVLPEGGLEVFRRFEPVAAPTLLPRSRFTEGSSAHRMVIRSSGERSAAQYAAEFNASDLVTSGAHPPYESADERHVVTPKASLECVERHGMLDAAIGSADPKVRRAAYDIAVRESGSLDDPSLPGVERVELPRAAESDPPRHYVLHTGDQVDLPYLPDPLSEGVVFHSLPGAPGGRQVEVPWDGASWHTPKSLRLRIVEGTGPPRFEASARVLTVALPKAAVATVRVCSRVRVDEKVMGLLHWCRELLTPEQFSQVVAAADGNRCWMLTPWHEVTLVHAVQRPLARPSLTLFDSPDRGLGATGEHLFGTVDLDVASTERIDLQAQWSETIDDLEQPEPQVRQVTAPVFSLQLALAARFAGDATILEVPCKLDGSTLSFNTQVAEANTPPTPEKHELGDTKHRLVRYQPVATSPFSEYFPPEFAQEPEKELLSARGDPVEHVVLSSAKPTAPRVIYCIPTLAFDTSGSLPRKMTRRRRGGGLRIYLARPWFSSGDGELLGVLVNDEEDEPPDVAHPFITLFGRDPIHRSATITHPGAEAFKSAARIAPNVVLPEVFDGFTVTVAGYLPQYDKATGRWFCDIDIDTGDAYFPFVRLALARFQPHSLEGTHLSPVVLTDIVRTLPERLLTVSGTDPLSVTLTGPSYLADDSTPARVMAMLQRRDTTIPDEVLGWVEIEEGTAELEADDAGSTTATYSGGLLMPERPPGERRRLLVVEIEAVQADAEEPGVSADRVIYTDAVEL